MSARPKTPLVLSATEREQLIELAKRRKTAQANSFESLPFFIGAVIIAHQLVS